ncbi:ATP-binding cassette domain-containing protein, partial [Ramlibacter sp.]|uniref:ATP-binding cassette domain-containing protein n=1 Tax=Ramlibacter sp. TaxID=1917967 RepID=UPI002610E9AD
MEDVAVAALERLLQLGRGRRASSAPCGRCRYSTSTAAAARSACNANPRHGEPSRRAGIRRQHHQPVHARQREARTPGHPTGRAAQHRAQAQRRMQHAWQSHIGLEAGGAVDRGRPIQPGRRLADGARPPWVSTARCTRHATRWRCRGKERARHKERNGRKDATHRDHCRQFLHRPLPLQRCRTERIPFLARCVLNIAMRHAAVRLSTLQCSTSGDNLDRFARASMALITLANAQLAFGHVALLDHADFSLQAGERVGLIGRNGAGKSSLLKILGGMERPDDGEVQLQQNLRSAFVAQEPVLVESDTVSEAVRAGLADLLDVLDQYSSGEGDLDALQSRIEAQDGWNWQQRVDETMERLRLDPAALIGTLSGGNRKRVALAQALVRRPDVLLLDEPTNHLDLDSIEWLENLLIDFRGSVVLITHDRTFLDRVATRIVELDRGRLLS